MKMKKLIKKKENNSLKKLELFLIVLQQKMERVLKHYEFVTSAVDTWGAHYGLHLKLEK